MNPLHLSRAQSYGMETKSNNLKSWTIAMATVGGDRDFTLIVAMGTTSLRNKGAGGARGESGALVPQEEQMVQAQAVRALCAHH